MLTCATKKIRPGAGIFAASRRKKREAGSKVQLPPQRGNIHGHAVEYDVKSNHALDVIKIQEMSSKDKLIGQRKVKLS